MPDPARSRTRATLALTLRPMLVMAVLSWAGCGPRADAPTGVDLSQPIASLAPARLPLQVAIHELVEAAPLGAAVRVCRSLAAQPVELGHEGVRTLQALLQDVAAQAGAELETRGRFDGTQRLPTLSCPDRAGSYLVIGRLPAGEP